LTAGDEDDGNRRLDCCIVFAAGVPLARITSGAGRSNRAAAWDSMKTNGPKRLTNLLGDNDPSVTIVALPKHRS
jgi:hypothetical protein